MRNNISAIQAINSDGKYIFISYSSRDKSIVDHDCAELRRHNVPLWIDDKLVAGFDWRYAIKAIRSKSCVGVIFYISENSIVSKPVQKELRAAAKRFGRPVPIDKNSTERLEGYFSVNIGGKCPLELRTDMRSAGKRTHIGRDFLKRFPKNVVYIARGTAPDSDDHLVKLLDTLELYDIMQPGVCDSLKYEIIPEGIAITGYAGNAKDIAIPEEIVGRKVVSIANDAFKMNTTAETVFIPDTVTSIGEGAFRKMTALRYIRLPENLQHLGEAAFRDTISLESIDLPKGIKTLNQAMFRGSGIKKLTIPEGVEELGEAIFAGCSSLETLSIPNTVVRMTEGGFSGCTNLRIISIPRSILGLNANSFSDCPEVDVVIGDYHYHNGTADKLS